MKHTVLVVEDEEDLREMLRDALELNGYAVVTASEGQAALERVAEIDQLCLVLLDLVMPGMNGWEFYEQIRQRPELASVPVIVHSSSPNSAPRGVYARAAQAADARLAPLGGARILCPSPGVDALEERSVGQVGCCAARRCRRNVLHEPER